MRKILQVKKEDPGSSIYIESNNLNYLSFNKKFCKGTEPLNDKHLHDLITKGSQRQNGIGKCYYQSVQQTIAKDESRTKSNLERT